ncbi:rRNA maturation RNase YbeY [bacterium]|nr:rRNA maturation RNase YbeY [bacterium]
MQIEIIDPEPRANINQFRKTIELILIEENKTAELVNVIFMGQDDLRSLKKQYFDLDIYTDVIAFNLNDPDQSIEGEVYLSFEQIQQNATQYKTDPQNELMRVLIHGCLHLCGYEDDTPERKTQMTSKEDHYLSKIGNIVS